MSYQPTEHNNYLLRMTKTLDPPKVQIEAYGGQSVHRLGSCILHLHIDNKAFLTIFEVTNITGPIILGRAQVKAMGYVQFQRLSGHILSPHTPLLQERYTHSKN